MDTSLLVEDEIKSGERLIEALDDAKFNVKTAFWQRLPETGDWRLYIASPKVKEYGPFGAYQRLIKIAKSRNIPTRFLQRVSLVFTNDPTVTLLRSAVSTGAGISKIPFRGNAINGVYIEDALLYRVT
jgi:hypothetical protein